MPGGRINIGGKLENDHNTARDMTPQAQIDIIPVFQTIERKFKDDQKINTSVFLLLKKNPKYLCIGDYLGSKILVEHHPSVNPKRIKIKKKLPVKFCSKYGHIGIGNLTWELPVFKLYILN